MKLFVISDYDFLNWRPEDYNFSLYFKLVFTGIFLRLGFSPFIKSVTSNPF